MVRRTTMTTVVSTCAVTVIAALVPASCSGDDGDNWQLGAIEVSDSNLEELPTSILSTAVSPLGDRIVTEIDNEVCMVGIGSSDVDETCLDEFRDFAPDAVAWSSDGTQALVTQNLSFFSEPDIGRIAPGDADVLTDDGVDEPEDDEALLDTTPFFGPDDDVYFFRRTADDRDAQLMRLAADGSDDEPEPVEGFDLDEDEAIDFGAVHTLSDRRFVGTAGRARRDDDGGLLAVIDLDAERIRLIELDDPAIVVSARESLVLTIDPQYFSRADIDGFSMVSLEDGSSETIDADADADDTRISAVGFGPDASFVTALEASRGAGSTQHLIGFDIEDGELGEPETIADADDLVPRSDDIDFLTAVGRIPQVVWSADGILVVGVGLGAVSIVATEPAT
jgi:hypothetical protein